jgi:hypothetical protein
MASRLYPGFGSGKGTYEGHFDVRSFASLGACTARAHRPVRNRQRAVWSERATGCKRTPS